MVGKLDKPLGLREPKPKSKTWVNTSVLIVATIIGAGIAGFILNGNLADKPNSNAPGVQTAKTEDPDSTQRDSTGSPNGFKKRPDLAIDNNAPGLQELTAENPGEIVTIIPKRRPDNIVKQQVLAHLPDAELVEPSSYGKLPRRSSDGLRPLDVYARQPLTEGNFGVARIVIIVGGIGISQTSSQQAISALPPGVTLAFAPYGNSLSRWMQTARKGGHEILMQIPMEPYGYPQTSAGNHSLLTSLEPDDNLQHLYWTLGKTTNYVGVMNFLGGKMLTSPNNLTPLFEELTDRGLMFVDDGSVRNSMAPSISKSTSLPFARAHIGIDTIRTRSQISKKLELLETRAKQTGLAIGVATAFPESISQIAKFLKNAKSRGLELTPVSAIASEPKG